MLENFLPKMLELKKKKMLELKAEFKEKNSLKNLKSCETPSLFFLISDFA